MSCSEWHNQFSCISPSTGLSPKCCKMKLGASALRLTRHPAGHSTAGILSRNPLQILSPVHRLWQQVPSLCTTDERGTGFQRASPSVQEAACTMADNPRHCPSGSMCCSCFGGWGEPQPMGSVMLLSNSPHAQDKSISAWYCHTQGLTLPVLPVVFFWWPSRNSGSSLLSGVKPWYSADSNWLYQLHFALLLFLTS